MPDDLLLPDGRHMRKVDALYVFEAVQDADCCSLVGVSNMGKSTLLRLVAEPSVYATFLTDAAQDVFVLVDCNRMLELSEQGFYELILRSIGDVLRGQDADAAPLAQLQAAYDLLIHPASSFDIPLSFNRGVTAALQEPNRNLVLLFDEFDQALAGIQGRVFLNLRALKDQYKRRLVYVTATDRPLRQVRDSSDVDEFCELFPHHTYFLPPLNEVDVRLYVQRFAEHEGVTFGAADEAFIYEWAGGHPGLLEATCRALGRVTGAPKRDELQDWMIHREVAGWLTDELTVRVECRKIWDQLSDAEQEALLGVSGSDGSGKQVVASLLEKHILLGGTDQPRFFSRLFGEFVQRLRATRRPKPRGVRVDVESGAVYVDGEEAPTLTKLEYRLFLLLYGRLGQIVSKYDVVEAVWGDDYIDEVDDARIEKLVSRLRNKIEPAPRNPKHIITVRGRGYRMDE